VVDIVAIDTNTQKVITDFT